MDQIDPETQRLTIGIVTVCLILSLASFVLRFYSRLTSAVNCWWDDYWQLLVMFLCIGMGIGEYLGLYYGAALQLDDPNDPTVMNFRRNIFASMLIWASGVFAVKIGIVLFYWRVFPAYRFRVASAFVIVLCLAIYLSNVGALIFQCVPVQKFWSSTMDGVCFDQTTFYFVSAIINVVSDVVILVLPLPIVWGLHTSRGQKISLSLLFLLGAFVCIASIFRAIAVGQIDTQNFTYTNVAGGLWSAVEVNLGFICANLPFIRPLISRWLGQDDSSDLHVDIAKSTTACPIRTSVYMDRAPCLPRHSMGMVRYSRRYSSYLSSRLSRHNNNVQSSDSQELLQHEYNSSSKDLENGFDSSGNDITAPGFVKVGIRRNNISDNALSSSVLSPPRARTHHRFLSPPQRAMLNGPLKHGQRSSEFSLSSRASPRSSIGGITVRRVVVLKVEGVTQTHHRAKSFETHVTSGENGARRHNDNNTEDGHDKVY